MDVGVCKKSLNVNVGVCKKSLNVTLVAILLQEDVSNVNVEACVQEESQCECWCVQEESQCGCFKARLRWTQFCNC